MSDSKRYALIGVLITLILFSGDGASDRKGLPSEGVRILIVEETADRHRLTEQQLSALFGVQLRQLVRSHRGELRIWDPDRPFPADPNSPDAPSPWYRAAFALPRTQDPWLIVDNGTEVISEPLPADVLARIQSLLE